MIYFLFVMNKARMTNKLILFNLIKNSKALFRTVKFLNVPDLAMSIISKK